MGGADHLGLLGGAVGLLVMRQERLPQAADEQAGADRLGQAAEHLQHAEVVRPQAAGVQRQQDEARRLEQQVRRPVDRRVFQERLALHAPVPPSRCLPWFPFPFPFPSS